MKQITIEATAKGVTDFKCVDRRGNAGTTYLVIVDMESGQGTVDFEFTPDDCIENDDPIWIQHDILKGLSSSCASILEVPFQGFRMNVKKYSQGTIKLRVVQSGFHDF
jgi:hypothetical protein